MSSIKPSTPRPLALDNLRTFACVAQHLSFSAAADALHLTQSAVSRRIQALEEAVGVALFVRDTRTVELTQAGELMRQAVLPALERIDRTVARLRNDQLRRHVSVTTFSTFATQWLLPRLSSFQEANPDIDIRIVADDKMLDLDDPQIDVALRYLVDATPPAHAERMFGEVVSPVASPMLMALIKAGRAPKLKALRDLAGHALLDQDLSHPGNRCVTWSYFLRARDEAEVEPRRRVVINYGHQIIQAAMAGQGVAMGRAALIHPNVERGELVEVFGPASRLVVPASYWIVPLPSAVLRPELRAFLTWLREQAAITRHALGEGVPANAAKTAARAVARTAARALARTVASTEATSAAIPTTKRATKKVPARARGTR